MLTYGANTCLYGLETREMRVVDKSGEETNTYLSEEIKSLTEEKRMREKDGVVMRDMDMTRE